MNARDAILDKLRKARSHDRTAAATAPDVAAYYTAQAKPLDIDTRIAQLSRHLQAAHAEVLLTDADGWPSLLAKRLSELAVQRVACGAGCKAAHQLAAAAAPGQLLLREFDYAKENRKTESWKTTLIDDIDAGFTVADSAIAATGTLVLRSSARQPRSLSLVPPLHIALLRAETIHADLYGAAQAEAWPQDLPANLILISGPSKTSDIQQTVAYGAHGPKQLLVVVIRQEPRT